VKKARVTVEQAFGTFKTRNRAVHAQLRINMNMVPTVIIALAVLHNLAIKWGEVMLMYDTGDPEEQPDEVKIGATGDETRRNMVASCFQ